MEARPVEASRSDLTSAGGVERTYLLSLRPAACGLGHSVEVVLLQMVSAWHADFS